MSEGMIVGCVTAETRNGETEGSLSVEGRKKEKAQ